MESKIPIDKALDLLGNPETWKKPDGYPNSLALCVIDSIWSIGIRYPTVVKVINRYLEHRGYDEDEAHQICTDGTSDFLMWYRALENGKTSPQVLAIQLKNRNHTSSSKGKLKAEAVVQAFELFEVLGIESTQDLIEQSEDVESRWLSQIHGQRSGISWKYLLMLCGQPGVKPDRMMFRFMERVGVDIKFTSPEEFVDQIVETIGIESVNATAVDHRIWSTERELSKPPRLLRIRSLKN
jgi:hypothetical protein